MNEAAARIRQPIDLEEFERRLRGAAPVERRLPELQAQAPQHAAQQPQQLDAPYGASQSLSDYARIMGAGASAPAPSYAPAPTYAPAVDPASPALDLDPYRAERAAAPRLADAAYDPYPRSAPPVQSHGAYDAPQQPEPEWRPERDPYADAQSGAYGHVSADPYAEQAAAAPARSRRPMMLIGGAVAVCVVGIGVTYAMRGGSSAPREAPTIKAASGPVKVQPEQTKPEGQAAQSASILDRNGDERLAASRVVNREEQPVDIREAARSARADAPSAPQAGNAFFPEPRRVRTVAVRPDGTIAQESSAPATAAPSAAPAAATPAAAPPARPQPPGAAPVRPQQAPAAPAAPKVTERAGAVTPSSATPGAGAPPRNLVPPTQTASTTPAPAAAAPAAAGGGYAVQLAAPGSEAEARAAIARIRQQHGSVLGSLQPTTAKASVNGRDIYRVRVVGLSQDGANALCNRLKASGGSCFVARN